jgi:hypothetical protein
MPENLNAELKPLNITCTSTDCQNDLHCFKKKKQRKERMLGGPDASNSDEGENSSLRGKCRTCGADLIDWERVDKHDLSDTAYTFNALRKELVRHYYWHLAVDQHAKNHALRKGSIEMRAYVKKRIHTSVGPEKPYRDGIQTRAHQSGNIVFYAQHATASCCRVCMEIWHGIPRGRALTQSEVRYLTELAMLYINERLPELTPEGKKIPPIRQKPKDSSRS